MRTAEMITQMQYLAVVELSVGGAGEASKRRIAKHTTTFYLIHNVQVMPVLDTSNYQKDDKNEVMKKR